MLLRARSKVEDENLLLHLLVQGIDDGTILMHLPLLCSQCCHQHNRSGNRLGA